MARDGLFYLSKRTASDAQLALYRFDDHSSRMLAWIEYPVHPVLTGTAGGQSVLSSQVDQQDTDLMVLDPYAGLRDMPVSSWFHGMKPIRVYLSVAVTIIATNEQGAYAAADH